jgi:hypothetical protein
MFQLFVHGEFIFRLRPNVINFSIVHPILTQLCLQNDHLIELLVGHSNILVCYF